jgi:DNA topoisomerase VI subunit B
MAKATVTVALEIDDRIALKDLAKATKVSQAEHLRRAVREYLKRHAVIGPDTKITVSTPEGPKPYRETVQVKPQAPQIDFHHPEKPDIDPSTGQPIE